MSIKKIIKGMIGLGVVSGIAYAAFKVGENNGEINERFRDKYDDEEDNDDIVTDDEDDIRFYDEPDEGCIAPAREYEPSLSVNIHNCASLDTVKVDGVSETAMDMLVYHISLDKYTSNKQIREWLNVDRETAAKVILALRKAGYVGEEHSNYMIPVHITTEMYFRLRGGLH